MDPNQIAQMLASGDQKKVVEAQKQLQALGYNVKPDGKLGDATSAAVKAYRDDLAATNKTNLDIENAKTEGKKAENDPTARLTKMGTEFGPWVGGAGIGVTNAILGSKKFDKMDAKQADGASRLSRALDVTPEAAQAGLRRMDNQRAARAGKQFLGPAGWFGAGALTSEVVAPRFKDDPETQKYINLAATTENAAGTSMLAKQLYDLSTRGDPIDPEDRARIGSKGPPPSAPPSVPPPPPPAGNLPPPNNPPPPPPPDGPPPPPNNNPPQMRPNSERLVAAAREAGASGPLNKTTAAEYLAKNVSDANRGAVARALGVNNGPNLASRLSTTIGNMAGKRGASSVMLPLAAGGLAYEMTRNQAQAADGSGGAGSPLAAGATTAGAVGLSQALASKLPGLMRGLGVAGNVAGTAAGAHQNAREAMQYRDAQPPEQQASPFGQLMPHAMPLAMRGAQDVQSIMSAPGRLSQALQSMPQVPQSEASTMYGMDPQQPQMPPPEPQQSAPQKPMMTAAALPLPQNVDPEATQQANIASGMEPQAAESPFPPQIDGRVKRMLANGASPQQVAAFLNSAIR